MKAEQVLDEAGQLLSKPGGWMQRGYSDLKGTTFCSYGAIHKVYNDHGHFMNFATAEATPAAKALRQVLGNVGYDVIIEWNDHPRRTQSQVVAMFEKARAYAAEHDL